MLIDPADARPRRFHGTAAAIWIWAAAAFAVGTMLYAAGRWWLPPLASEQGAQVDTLFRIILAVSATVFIGVHLLLGIALVRFGDRGHGAAHWHDNPRLELTWTFLTALVLASLTVLGAVVWVRLHGMRPADGLTVEVTAEQFGWLYRYPGPDGVFGRTDLRQVAGRNPLGLDLSDPAAQDDVVTRELHLVTGRPARLLIRSKDVIHSFFVPSMRFKQDAVPGRTIERWVTPVESGRFSVACAELCGVGHFLMASSVVVESGDQFERWLQAQAPSQAALAMR